MKLSRLLNDFPGALNAQTAALDASSVCFDSRRLQNGCVFVAIRGAKADGHAHLAEAVAHGAVALVIESGPVPTEFRGAVVTVTDSRKALNKIAALFYEQASRSLFSIGVTGTNGKTTITNMIEAILTAAGRPTGVIGTIDHHLRAPSGTHLWPTELTTPDPVEFQKRLREFVDLGARAVAMEVSSIGLRQSRIDEVDFDAAVFTNLTRDHLDYHQDMEDYFDAKRRLFVDLLARSPKAKRVAIVNSDDGYGRRLMKELEGKTVTTWSYGNGAGHALSFQILDQGFFGTRFQLETPLGAHEFRIAIPGLHNVYNATAAIGAGLAAGAGLDTAAGALAALPGVKGRLEAVPNARGLYIFVDYAHTDDGLVTVLDALGRIRREAGVRNQIITVFGCGGDRDKGKRPLMMKAAEGGSDIVVVTSDNPRTENPEAIIRDALVAATPTKIGATIFPVTDRRVAIRRAIEMANRGDVILIAGKGHEDYQIIGTTKHPFSDFEIVREILQ